MPILMGLPLFSGRIQRNWRIKPNPDCHDRLIVLDYDEETEQVYLCFKQHGGMGQEKSCGYLLFRENHESSKYPPFIVTKTKPARATHFVLRTYKKEGRLYQDEEIDERECTVL